MIETELYTRHPLTEPHYPRGIKTGRLWIRAILAAHILKTTGTQRPVLVLEVIARSNSGAERLEAVALHQLHAAWTTTQPELAQLAAVVRELYARHPPQPGPPLPIGPSGVSVPDAIEE